MNKKSMCVALAFIMLAQNVFPFCGFYVAAAGTKLYNQKSEVIIVRDGTLTTLTMSNDFKGDAKDFAMVVPVPEVLRERDIKVVNRDIFDKIDAYSAPRLVEYYDESPCGMEDYKKFKYLDLAPMSNSATKAESLREEKELGITIEAKYTIGEYDIILLSAEQSSGLETWLNSNGYSIPQNAQEVLQPYINNKLKFFVVKVNLNNQKQFGFNYLRPIQITFNSERFMLPIRLGMANANGPQDLIVYTFTKVGRVECTNYRTEKMPTGNNIPTFAMSQFDSFYIKNFNKQYIKNAKNTVFLEYAWNVTPSFSGVKCDPCIGNPPMLDEFRQAGVNWLNDNPNASVFFTRMHVRYTRNEFPQDLMFQTTPNTESYQARYVINHPSTNTDCSEGKKYLQALEGRKLNEVIEYCKLTGENPYKYSWYAPLLNAVKQLEQQPSQGKVDLDKLINTLEDSNVYNAQVIPNSMEGSDDNKTNHPINELLILLIPIGLLAYAFFRRNIKVQKILKAK